MVAWMCPVRSCLRLGQQRLAVMPAGSHTRLLRHQYARCNSRCAAFAPLSVVLQKFLLGAAGFRAFVDAPGCQGIALLHEPEPRIENPF